jgi:hypothetical protein
LTLLLPVDRWWGRGARRADRRRRRRSSRFIEKEGFDPLLQQARIAERFDIAIMSTKGMSVTAARMLLDRLAPKIDRLFVLHDFDISGFSIAGTLTADGRRYIYDNAVDMVDLGLRLPDVLAMDLQLEPVMIEGGLDARAETLRDHGASEAEIAFLLGTDGAQPRRVELNAMTSRQFVDFLDRKLAEAGVEKVVPEADIIEQHARRLVQQTLTEEALDEIRDRLAKQAAAQSLLGDLDCFSSATRSGQTRCIRGSLLTTAPDASISVIRMSKARPPSSTDRPSASSSRRCGRIRNRPNSSAAGVDGVDSM